MPLLPRQPDGTPLAGGTPWVEELMRELDRQGVLLSRLEAMSRDQRALIDQDDVEPLLAVLSDRQRVIEEVTRGVRASEGLRQRWEAERSSLPEVVRAGVQRRLDELSAAVAAIAARDEQDEALMRSRRDRVGDELRQVERSRRAMGAYADAKATGATARFQDRRA